MSSGLFHDGWAGRDLALQIAAERPILAITLRGDIPDDFPQQARRF
ncbi:MAG TPA: hypothetical protein VGS12_02145 [Caulobacteraceae bacterium]|nr:hypothetical protein [Caulobacteraceae bacterium]